MPCSVTRADRGFTARYLGLVCLVLAFSEASAELPPARELIRQTQDACKEYEDREGEKAGWPLLELAKAQAYTGDYAQNIETARSIPGFWKVAAVCGCWQIHFEHTGTIAEFPAELFAESDLDKLENTTARVEIAKVLAKAGRLGEATKFLPKDEENRGTAYSLTEFYLFLAQEQAQRGDRQGAATNLKRAATFSERFKDNPKRVEWIETMVRVWIKIENQAEARAARDAAVQLLRERRKKKPNEYLSLYWARLGKLHVLLGQQNLAREAFAEALRLADAADKNAKEEGIQDENLRADSYSRAVAQIGAWQFTCGFKTEAAESYRRAVARAEQIQPDGMRDYQLLRLLELQRDEGDIDGALKTLERMQSAYYKTLGYCSCAQKLATDGQAPAAQRLLQKAEALADAEPEPKHSTDMWGKIAEVKAKAHDLPAAKHCLERALKLSRGTEANDHHQWIARCQIRLGLLDDAHQTIRAIPQPEWRLLPLAELTHQAAKRDAMARKKGVEK